MILATCGSTGIPFSRMMQALAALPAADLHVQHGTAAPPSCARADAYLPFGVILENVEQANVVVSHAGVGTIMCSLRAKNAPILFSEAAEVWRNG